MMIFMDASSYFETDKRAVTTTVTFFLHFMTIDTQFHTTAVTDWQQKSSINDATLW
jgi:hypothetical protein